MTRFFALFVLTLAVLFGVEKLNAMQAALIDPWTHGLARLSAVLMTAFDDDVFSHGRILQSASTGQGVSIEAGCNGIEAALVLLSAMLAFPAPWRLKLLGMAAGLVAVQAANVLRVISLYYLNLWNAQWFEFAHLYLWQALIMLDVLLVWLLWMRAVARHHGQRLAQAAAP